MATTETTPSSNQTSDLGHVEHKSVENGAEVSGEKSSVQPREAEVAQLSKSIMKDKPTPEVSITPGEDKLDGRKISGTASEEATKKEETKTPAATSGQTEPFNDKESVTPTDLRQKELVEKMKYDSPYPSDIVGEPAKNVPASLREDTPASKELSVPEPVIEDVEKEGKPEELTAPKDKGIVQTPAASESIEKPQEEKASDVIETGEGAMFSKASEGPVDTNPKANESIEKPQVDNTSNEGKYATESEDPEVSADASGKSGIIEAGEGAVLSKSLDQGPVDTKPSSETKEVDEPVKKESGTPSAEQAIRAAQPDPEGSFADPAQSIAAMTPPVKEAEEKLKALEENQTTATEENFEGAKLAGSLESEPNEPIKEQNVEKERVPASVGDSGSKADNSPKGASVDTEEDEGPAKGTDTSVYSGTFEEKRDQGSLEGEKSSTAADSGDNKIEEAQKLDRGLPETTKQPEQTTVDKHQEVEKTDRDLPVSTTDASEPKLSDESTKQPKKTKEDKKQEVEKIDPDLPVSTTDASEIKISGDPAKQPEETTEAAADTSADKKDEGVEKVDRILTETPSDLIQAKTDGETPKQDTAAAPAKSSHKSGNIISKVKHSMGKVKKAILGKSPSSKNDSTTATEVKDDTEAK